MYPNLTIKLDCSRRNLEGFYFNDENKSFWNQSRIKRRLALAVAAFVIGVLSIPLGQKLNLIFSVVLASVSLTAFIVLLAILVTQLIRFLKWKRHVGGFIKKVEGITGKIECTTTAFIYSNPDETCVIRWEEIMQVRIFKSYLLLNTSTDKFMFIATTMEPDEYRNLCEVLESTVTRGSNSAHFNHE